jgi:hypothetical protein
MELEFSRPILEKYPNINFHENPSSGNGAVAWPLRDTPKQTVAFRNFANAPKNDDEDDNDEGDDISSNNLCQS